MPVPEQSPKPSALSMYADAPANGRTSKTSMTMSPSPSNNKIDVEIPKGYTQKEKRQAFYLAQIQELTSVPKFLKRELARQEDQEVISKKKKQVEGIKGLLLDPSKMGHHARKRYD